MERIHTGAISIQSLSQPTNPKKEGVHQRQRQSNQRTRARLRENENIHEKPQLHEIWCGQSYLYMPYGTYGLGEIRASLIPLAELNSVKPVLQVRARALLRLFPSEGQVK
jgi:hypothetical protein